MATDENFTDVVQSGTEIAAAYQAHSVHVSPYGLEPARYYWYRFKVGDEISPVGRTKTPPPPGASLSAMSFAFRLVCGLPGGLLPAYRAIAEEEDLDVVFHLGDYICEYAPDPDSTRVAQTPAPEDIETYRNTYAEQKLDRGCKQPTLCIPGGDSRRPRGLQQLRGPRGAVRRPPSWPTGACP